MGEHAAARTVSTLARSFFEIVGDPPVDESQRPTADYQIVSPDLLPDARSADRRRPRLHRPRYARQRPGLHRQRSVRPRPLQGRSPIGLRVALRPTASPQAPPVVREIVGVARQVKGRPDETEDLVQIYVPMAQDLVDDIYLVVRPASGRAEALAPSVRAAIGRVDKEQLVSVRDVMTLDDVAWEATARHRFRAVLVMTFAGLALVLAMVGVFGILAYSVQQRVREFGVRRALGATTRDVLGLVVGSAVRVDRDRRRHRAGPVGGVLGRLLTTMLFGVQPLDPVTFASVTIVLALTAAVSIAGPAWRAARVDPAVALRGE